MVYLGQNLNIVVVCWIIFLLYWLISAFFVKKSMTRRNLWKGIIWRVAISILLVLFLSLNKSGNVSFLASIFTILFSFPVAGSIVSVLGLIGAIWSRVSLGREWSGYATYKKDHGLVTRGPYRFVRHPIYFSLVLMLIGAFLYYGYLFILIVFVIVIIDFMIRMIQEEKMMTGLFGKKYLDYTKRTWRLIPFVY